MTVPNLPGSLCLEVCIAVLRTFYYRGSASTGAREPHDVTILMLIQVDLVDLVYFIKVDLVDFIYEDLVDFI